MRARPRLGVAVIFIAGLAVSLVMVARSQVGGDQLELLARGWMLAVDGHWLPYGNATSAGGFSPGGLTNLLFGMPLLVVQDHRAAATVVLLAHVVAFILLDRMVFQAAGPRGRLLFAGLFWLNPWRMCFSAFVWNANLMVLAGALHAWTAWNQRRSPRFCSSLIHVMAVGLAMQIHASAVLLIFGSLVLLARRTFRLSLFGAAIGGLVVALSLLPWARAALQEPALMPAGEGFPLRGLLLVFPLLRGLGYWLRYPSFALPGKVTSLDFAPALGTDLARGIGPLADLVLVFLGGVTVAFALWANWRLWRRPAPRPDDPSQGRLSGRTWLRQYARGIFLASTAGFAVSPTTVMSWQLLTVLHATILPLLLVLQPLLRTRHRRATRVGLVATAAAALVVTLGAAVAAPMYRPGGMGVALRHDHPMLEALEISETSAVHVDHETGWWMRGVPEPPVADRRGE